MRRVKQTGSRFLVLAGLLLLVFAVGSAAAQEGVDTQHGGELYNEYCAMCHGADGKGRVGASLEDFPGIQVNATLEQTITEGVRGSVMPAWGQAFGGPLSDQDVADVAGYIAAVLGGTQPIAPAPTYQAPEIPPLPDVEGNPSIGAEVFQANCIVCHGEQAQGGFGRPLAKSWPGNQPQAYLVQVISQGIPGTVMPGWKVEDGGPLSEDQIFDLTAFILSLSPTGVEPTPGPPPEGPLTVSTSLIIFGLLGLVIIISLVVYYRRA